MKKYQESLAALHGAVMLFGLSAVLGRAVSVPAVLVAGGRVICSALLLGVLCLAAGLPLRLRSCRDVALTVGAGAVLALHWTAFFQAVQCSSVAVGTLTFSTFPLFVAFLEPLAFREKLRPRGLLWAGLLLVGVLITVPELSLTNQITQGAAWGMASSFAYAVMTLCNRRLAGEYPARLICLYEQGAAALILLPAFFWIRADWSAADLAGVAAIGFLCTALAHSLYVAAQRWVKAQTAGLISGMETVYSILYAMIFLGEAPTLREWLGGAVILGVAAASTLTAGEKEKAPPGLLSGKEGDLKP